MRQLAVVVLMLLIVAVPAFAKTHKDTYPVSCSVLWPAVKDALRNSGKYGILGIDSNEMTASFVIGGTLGGKRINSVVLNSKGDSCEMQTQTAYSGLIHNDAGDFKSRVDESLAKMKTSAPAATTAAAKADAKPEAKPEEKAEAKPEEKTETKSEAKPQSQNK